MRSPEGPFPEAQEKPQNDAGRRPWTGGRSEVLSTAELPEEFNRRIARRIPVLATGQARCLHGVTRPLFKVATTDVSGSGLMVTCPPWVQVGPGDELHMVFPAERPERTADLTGRVVWKKPGGGDPAARALGEVASPWRIGIVLQEEYRPEIQKILDQD